SGRSARASRDGRWLLDRSNPSDEPAVQGILQGDRRHHRANPARSEGLSRRTAHMLYAGSLVFKPPRRITGLRDLSQWWTFMKSADWRHPYGPKSNINVLDNHPVVHVSFADAMAYATWAGKDLPTEAEGELAARGGLDSEEFAWGNALTPG